MIRRIILKLEQKKLQCELNKLFKNYSVDWHSYAKKLCMSWEEIESLAKDSLCTIGNHTVNHYALNKLSEGEVREEIIKANKEIEKHIGRKVEHFSYPFGSFSEVGKREVRITKELGFKTCVTTRRGTIYPEHRNYMECLPRIMLIENFNVKDIGRIRRKRVVTL